MSPYPSVSVCWNEYCVIINFITKYWAKDRGDSGGRPRREIGGGGGGTKRDPGVGGGGGGNTKRDPGRGGGGANTKINRGRGGATTTKIHGGGGGGTKRDRGGGGGGGVRQYFKYVTTHSNYVFNKVYLNTKIDWRLQLIRINR